MSLEDLDSLVGDFTSDMSMVGVEGYRGMCQKCRQPVIGVEDSLKLDGKAFHKPCFVCAYCNCQLGVQVFRVVDNDRICESCFENRVLQKCDLCNKNITDEIVQYGGKNYHNVCFRCDHCNASVANQAFYQHNGKVYCAPDYENIFLPICFGCNIRITSSEDLKHCVVIDGNKYHPNCFKCAACHVPFADLKAFKKDGQFLCQAHYDERTQRK